MKVAVVGAGRNGYHFIQGYSRHPLITAIVVADPNPRHRALCADLPKVAGAYASFDELLDAHQPGIVSIHSPDACHAEPFLKACAAGCHVFVEKPLADRLEDVERMVAAAARNKTGKTMVGHVCRYETLNRKIFKLIRAGAIGKVVCARIGYIADYLHFYRVEQNPRFDAKPPAPISALVHGVCHHVDLIAWLTGSEPLSVYCARYPLDVHGVRHDWEAALVRFSGNEIAHFDGCFAALAPHRPLGLEIYGTKGTIRDGMLYTPKNIARQTYHAKKILSNAADRREHPFKAEIADFLGAVEDDTAVPISVPEGARAAAAVIVARDNADSGKEIPVPRF